MIHQRGLILCLWAAIIWYSVVECSNQRKKASLKRMNNFAVGNQQQNNPLAGRINFSVRKSQTIVLVQKKNARRKAIIKCCGVNSCRVIKSKSRNSSRENDADGAKSGTKPVTGGALGSTVSAPKNEQPAGSGAATTAAAAAGGDAADGGGGGDAGAAGGGDAGAATDGGAAAPTELPTTTAAAVGYTGRTAGEDGDYGEEAAPAAGGAAGGMTTVSSSGGGGGAGATGSTNNTGTATVTNGTASGTNGTASGTNGTASGTNGTASGTNGTASGTSVSNGTGSAGGTGANGTSTNGTKSNSTTSGGNSTSTSPGGTNSTINGTSGGAGSNSTSTGGTNGTTAGNTTGTNSSSTASGSNSTSANSTASGGANSTSTNATGAMGGNSTGSGSNSTASGSNSTSTSGNSTGGSNSTEQKSTTPNSATIIPKSNPCMDDGCVLPCVKDDKYFSGGNLSVPATKGVIETICDKKYFLSVEQVVHANAFKECCAIGMKLAVLDTKAEQECIQSYNEKTLKKEKEPYWLAASDLACKLKFAWCSGKDVDLATYQWVPSQPNHLPDQNCLVHFFDLAGATKFPGLNDYECSVAQRYLCEE